jgi:hypothetical protein
MTDKRTKSKNIPFSGRLITSNATAIGENYRDLKNLEYTDTHLKGVAGMTKINSSVMNATYLKARNAFHFDKKQPAESHVLAQAYNTGLTASQVLENTAAIPSAGNFSATALYTDSSGAGTGRFSIAPDGQVLYANGVDTCIWGGNETKVGAVIQTTVALAAAISVATSPKDYTDQMNNTKSDAANVMTCGGSYKTFLIGSTRPAKGATFTVSSANTTANTLTIKESTAGVWTTITADADGTRASGKTFAQTGSITWPTTVATTKTKYLEGYYLYWYEFTIDDGSAGISHITLDLPFQNIIDIWDGIYRDIARFYVYTSSQSDKSINVFREDYDPTTASTYADISSLAATTQYLEIGFIEKQTGLYVAIVPGYENSHAVAVAATGVITMSGIAVADETFVIDDQTFTWKASRSVAGEVTIGASAADAVTNIVTAVTADLSTVTAADGAGDTVDITAVTTGTAGNAIVFTENSTNMAVDGSGTLTGGVDAGLASVDYWGGSSYVSVGNVSDGTTTTGTSFTKTGVLSWNNTDLASEQKKQYANSASLYYYRVKFDEALDASVRIDYIGGISAPETVSHFKFPVFAQGRTLLCCDMSGAKNKAICSGKYMPQVYNGVDSVDIYFGEEGELTCGTELFSQFGSALYSVILMFKDTESWMVVGQDIDEWANNIFLVASGIGCPAPLTLKTISLFSNSGDTPSTRSLAIWQGANGIYMSDGRSPIPIHGDIKEYFDPRDSRSIKASMVGDSVGTIDHLRQRYHWWFASGTGATALNKELVYDIPRNKWFEIDRGTYLQCGVEVRDTDGNPYSYGFIDTGYMERLENGTTFDGTDITHTVHFGEIALDALEFGTRLDGVRLITTAKTTTANEITLTHYSDTSTSGTAKTMSPANSGHGAAIPEFDEQLDGNPFHSFKLTMVTDDETTGFEPLMMIAKYHATHKD